MIEYIADDTHADFRHDRAFYGRDPRGGAEFAGHGTAARKRIDSGKSLKNRTVSNWLYSIMVGDVHLKETHPDFPEEFVSGRFAAQRQ